MVDDQRWHPQESEPQGWGMVPDSSAQTHAAPGRRARRWVIPLVGALGLLLFLPVIFMGVAEGWSGEAFLVPGIPLALLLVILAFVGATPEPGAAHAGLPAPFGSRPYSAPLGTPWRSLHAALPTPLQGIHRALLWSPAVAVTVAAALVIAAIVLGPHGHAAAASGPGIIVGGLLLLGAYAVASYRALVPTAGALLAGGLLVQAQAVADAWGVQHTWTIWALFLLIPIVAVQALSAEAACRIRPRPFWSAWAAVGTLLAMAYPVWLFVGRPAAAGDLPLGMSLASLVWGMAAVFAFAPLPRIVRTAGISVFAAWAATLLLAYVWQTDLAARLQAAGLVAAAAVTVVAFIAYCVIPKKPRPDP